MPSSSVSKDEAKKSDNKKTDTAEEKKDGSSDGTGTGWTSEQDAKIKEMKADNKSWKDIALEVGASKKGVQNRYKELTKSDGESEKKPKEKKNDGEERSTWDSSGGGDTSGWTTIVDDDPLMGTENANMPDFGALFDDLDEGKGDGEGEKKDEEKSAGAWGIDNAGSNDWSKNDTGGNGRGNKSSADKSTDGGKKQKGGKNNKGKQQNNSGGNSWNSNHSGTTNTGSSTSSPWATTNSSSLYNDSHHSNDSCSRFGAPFVDAPNPSPSQDFGCGSKSGGVGKLKPDGAWSEDDCEVLEWLMNRYKEDKWLHIQSGFYNWTKRMVSWEIIEQKFKDDGAL